MLLALPSGLGNGAEPTAAPGLQRTLVSGTWHDHRRPSLFYDQYICFLAWEMEEKSTGVENRRCARHSTKET